MASTGRVMEKSAGGGGGGQEHNQHQEQQQSLKCPRCDSSNTKFCYYNNYSLSQPRHFCKACKRYWTRGGTLRNVPVGGGCRKNKRVKRPSSSSSIDSAPSSASAAPPPLINLNPPSSSSRGSQIDHVSPLFYGLPTNPSDLNLPFPRLFNSRASINEDTVSGYNDLQLQSGLGFSSGIIAAAGDARTDDYRNGFNPAKHIQDLVTSSSFLSQNYSIFGSSSSSSTSTPTMASLLNSSLQHHKFMNGTDLKESRGGANHFQTLVPYEDLQISGNNTSMAMKEVKSEQGHNNILEWNTTTVNVPCQNQIDQIGSSDPSIYWNLTGLGAWPDLPNMGSSVTSLI